MKQLLEFIPLILFFTIYKLYDVQLAAIVLVAATFIQLIILKVICKEISKGQWISGIFIIIFGFLTAYLNDLAFLKLKVTIVNLIFAAALLICQFVLNKPLLQRILEKNVSLLASQWKMLNVAWAGFFILCASINEIITHFYSDDVWVTFKAFGLTGLSLIAFILTAIYLYPHLKDTEKTDNGK